MKQKFVIKVDLCCDKCQTKALTIAARADGVSSVALEGNDKDRVVVVGDGVDAAELTCSLRKKFKCASIISVEEVKPKAAGDKGKTPEKKPSCHPPTPTPCCPPPCHPPTYCELYKVVCDPNPPSCTLM